MPASLHIILPAHNEADNIVPIYDEIIQHVNSSEYDLSILFVDDGSTDNTLHAISKLAAKDERVKYIEHSRNFGHQNAIKAGLDYTTADVVIMMDCDLQHPPELISKMLSAYREGYDIVRTYRMDASHQSYFKKKSSALFYRFLNYFSEIKMEPGSADFRLVSGKALEQLKSFNEFDLFYRGLIKWMGFNQISIAYEPGQRVAGSTKYTTKRMLSFGLKGFTSFSTKPLYFAAYLGVSVSFLSLLYLPYVFYSIYIGTNVAGWASAIVTIALFGGLNLMVLGIIGIYLSKLFLQSKDRPHYIVKSSNL